MPRLRKMRRKQKFQYDVNRRTLNKNRSKLPKINCDAVREAWDSRQSLTTNLTSMGLLADPNKSILTSRKPTVDTQEEQIAHGSKADVAERLQKEAKEGFEKKKLTPHTLPPEMVKKLCKFLDTHGEDYDAMARDPTNFYQETAAQLKSQIAKLKKIPQQWVPYLKSRNLVPTENSETSE